MEITNEQHWKLICKNKLDKEKDYSQPFIGSFEELIKKINEVNSNVCAYRIVDFELINKPVETTNEQLPINLKIKIMNVLSKHVDIRNSDNLKDRDLYHSFLDWEKEMWKLIV